MSVKLDTASLLEGDFRATMTHGLAFMKHLENHADELSAAMRQRCLDDLLSLLAALRAFQCDHCEVDIALVQRGARAVCNYCDSLFATCDGCKDDVLISEAILVEGPKIISLYHPACAPQME